MPEPALLRPAGPRDLDTLLALIREFYLEDGHPYDERKLTSALGPLLENEQYGIVWLIDEPPAGYAIVIWGYSLESGGPDALLDEIYVRERGRGLGGRALEAILEDLRRRGLSRMFLETEGHNRRARRFYARHGFEEEDSVWMTWEAGRD